MKAILKRFRFSLYFFLAFTIPFIFVPVEKLGGWYSALMLFVFFPCWIVFLLWAIYRAIKDIVLHCQGEDWPEDKPLGEIEFVKSVIKYISDEIDDVKGMSKAMKTRYFVFMIGGLLLSIAGLAIIIFFCFSVLMIIIGTVVLILGIAIMKLSSTEHYSGVSDDITMLDNKTGISVDELFESIKNVRTPFGKARRAIMIASTSECIAFETGDSSMIFVYPTNHMEGFFVYNGTKVSLKKFVDEYDEYEDDEYEENGYDEYDEKENRDDSNVKTEEVERYIETDSENMYEAIIQLVTEYIEGDSETASDEDEEE